MFVWESKLHSQVAWIQRPWNWTRQAWSWFGYIIESIFFNGNTWTDLYNFNNHCLLFVTQSFPFYFYLPNLQEDRNAGQVKWLQPHLRNCIQQIFSPRIWPPWPHKGENWALRHSKKYCKILLPISIFFHSWRAWSTLILLTAMENPIWRTPESTLKQEFM